MQPEQPADGEKSRPVSEDGIARMYRFAFVCVLSLLAGAAAAFALYQTRPGAAGGRGTAVERPHVVPDAGADALAVEDPAAEGARAGDGGTMAADEAEDETGVPVRGERRREARAWGRAGTGERAGHDARATRRDARVSGGRAVGGPGLGARALSGVKKTGEGVKKTGTAIGRTVGKIGGLFHE